ncbi:MAG: diaminopimelate epimerase [Bacteroidetes bacterium]|nr:diaminopimelate epimerase [Bacteroidota bacterium]
MIEISFTKMNGAGNDFVVLNNFNGALQIELPDFAEAVCARGFGIGADGLLVLQKSRESDFEMIYLNSDGSEGGMCGNGGRCIARFAVLNGICKPTMHFTAHGGSYAAEVFGHDKVRLHLPDPDKVTPSMKIPLGSQFLDATYVHPNTDHVVLTSGGGFDKVDSADLLALARKVRYNFEIFPKGTNVNLIEKIAENKIRMRTYERGVENETLACGTGAVASAITSSIRYGVQSPVSILTTGGETLKVSFDRTNNRFSNIVLEGSARVVFQGKVLYNEQNHKVLDLIDGQGQI